LAQGVHKYQMCTAGADVCSIMTSQMYLRRKTQMARLPKAFENI